MKQTNRQQNGISAFILLITLTCLATAGCNRTWGTHAPTECGLKTLKALRRRPAGSDFALISKQVFQPHCLKCHASDVAKGDVVLDVYSSAFTLRLTFEKWSIPTRCHERQLHFRLN